MKYYSVCKASSEAIHAAAIAHVVGERDPHAHRQAAAMVSDWIWMWLDEEGAERSH